MVDFNKLKNSSSKVTIEELNKRVATATGGNNNYEDEDKDGTWWQPTVDKMGNGFAIIRFLPGSASDDVPYIRQWSHGFQGPTGKWYIAKSRTTLGKDERDPVTEFNNKLWDSKLPENEAQARKQKRKLHYISNIYVVSDPGNPENNGKVFKFKYGAKIFEKLKEAMTPEFDEEGRKIGDEGYNPQNNFDPFHLWEGANFRLKVRKHEGYRDASKSDFDSCKPLFDDDDRLEEVFNQQYVLKDLNDPSKFKSYAELKKYFDKVMGFDQASDAPNEDREEETKAEAPVFKKAEAKVFKEKAANKAPIVDTEDEGDDLEFFKNLAK